MRFSLQQALRGPVDEVLAAFVDPAFYAELGTLPNVEAPELLDQRVEGRIVRQRIRYRFAGELSSAVTRVIDPARLTWVDEAVFDLDAREATFRIVPDHYGNRLTASGRYRFVPAGGGTTRIIDGEIKVHMPLVGGKVERAILGGIERHLADEAALVGSWLQRRGDGA